MNTYMLIITFFIIMIFYYNLDLKSIETLNSELSKIKKEKKKYKRKHKKLYIHKHDHEHQLLHKHKHIKKHKNIGSLTETIGLTTLESSKIY